jgi:hypothetical protein
LDPFYKVADAYQTAADEADEAFHGDRSHADYDGKGFAEKMDNLATDIEGSGKLAVTIVVACMNILYILGCLTAILGVCCGSRTLLGIANFLGVFTLIIMAVTAPILLTASVMYADFCSADLGGPEVNLQVIIGHPEV